MEATARRPEGRVALVTGGSRGIGAAIAERLASEGAHVTLTYAAREDDARATVARIAAAGGGARALQADLADPEAAAAVVEAVVREAGRLDILVNNAGVGVLEPLEAITAASALRQLTVNLVSPLIAVRAAAPHLALTGGAVVSVSSINGARPVAGASVYSATKAGLEAVTRALAAELGPSGVRVNAVAPGPTDTEMLAGVTSPEARETLARQTPLGRLGRAEDIARVVAFLAHPDAGWINGEVVTCSGGI